MSSLSDLVRGGAAGAGAESTRASPSGSHQGASSSLLPFIPPDGSEGILGSQGGGGVLPELPSLTAGGTRS